MISRAEVLRAQIAQVRANGRSMLLLTCEEVEALLAAADAAPAPAADAQPDMATAPRKLTAKMRGAMASAWAEKAHANWDEVWAAALAAAPIAPPADARLPYDVKVGGVTFRKGVALSTFIKAAQHWHREAFPQGYDLTDEQRAANLANLLASADLSPTTCGYCNYDEAEGDLIEQCDKCKAIDAARRQAP